MMDREGEIPSRPQGVWYAIPPEGTHWVFDFRFHDFDMYDVDSTKQQLILKDGQIRLLTRTPQI